jgi:hypothetical protein
MDKKGTETWLYIRPDDTGREYGPFPSGDYTDFSSKGTFFFFGLPGGTYELTIIAKGHETYSGIYTVIPGQYQNTISIELEKKNP